MWLFRLVGEMEDRGVGDGQIFGYGSVDVYNIILYILMFFSFWEVGEDGN